MKNTAEPLQIIHTDPSSEEWAHPGIEYYDNVIYFGHPNGKALVAIDLTSLKERSWSLPSTEIHDIALGTYDDQLTAWVADPGLKARPLSGYEYDTRIGGVVVVDLASGQSHRLVNTGSSLLDLGRWRPTSVGLETRDQKVTAVWVADGYGDGLVHRISIDGKVLLTLDGADSGRAFDCPHGLLVRTVEGECEIIIADRGNHRLVHITLDGNFVRETTHPLIRDPSGLASTTDSVVVTELSGYLIEVTDDGDVRVIAGHPTSGQSGWPNIADAGRVLARPQLSDFAPRSPHGVSADPSGKVYFSEWIIGGRIAALP